MFSRRKAARIAPYVVVLGIAALLYRSASGIDFFAPAGRIGPDFWPKMVLILMIATCVYEIVKIGLFSSEESVSGVLQTFSASPPAAGEAPSLPDEGRTYPVRLALGHRGDGALRRRRAGRGLLPRHHRLPGGVHRVWDATGASGSRSP